ncbi:MAG: hypothetical protein QOJ62_2118 [Actinomycetota bacterium]|nr:hypothetical protein [Actinomycetota bacterium]
MDADGYPLSNVDAYDGMAGQMWRLRRATGWRPQCPDGSDAESGAAAVEFALVLPILILILFGIVDYGLYFSNSLDARSGVQTATRQAVVGNFDDSCGTPGDVNPPGASAHVGHLMCMVKNNTNAVAGNTYVKVAFPDDPANPEAPAGWYPGRQILVCQVVKVSGVSGFVPLPNGGVIRTKILSQIEKVERDQPTPDSGASEGSPPGGWGWCT